MPSQRNKTITVSPCEENTLLANCITPEKAISEDEARNIVIYDDVFHAAGKLPDGFVDLLIVDPPYNMTKTFGETVFRKSSAEEYRDFTFSWLNALRHTLKETASIYVCCDWCTSIIVGEVLSECFSVRNRITWQREKGRGSRTNWKNVSEDIWYATVSDKFCFEPERVMQRKRVIAPYKDENGAPKDWLETEKGKFRDTYPSNLWDDVSVPFWSMPENTPHPTQKPEKLAAKLILASSNENDTVLDPFMGSGTFVVTAKKLNRCFTGIEREKEYCCLAEKRLIAADKEKRIQGYSDGVFYERNINNTDTENKK